MGGTSSSRPSSSSRSAPERHVKTGRLKDSGGGPLLEGSQRGHRAARERRSTGEVARVGVRIAPRQQIRLRVGAEMASGDQRTEAAPGSPRDRTLEVDPPRGDPPPRPGRATASRATGGERRRWIAPPRTDVERRGAVRRSVSPAGKAEVHGRWRRAARWSRPMARRRTAEAVVARRRGSSHVGGVGCWRQEAMAAGLRRP